MLREGLSHYGIHEVTNAATIMEWAKECGLPRSEYASPAVPWCGLYMALCAKRVGWPAVASPLWARSWLKFGNTVPIQDAALGDVLVFTRDGGGHVGMYVGQDRQCYHVLGGNQGDAVSIVRISMGRLLGVRRAPWRIAQPANVRKVFLDPSGVVSTNEA